MPAGPCYVVTLIARPDATPPVVRLRRALKTLLRVYSLRCTRAEQLGPGSDSPRLRMTPAPLAAELLAVVQDLAALLQAAEGDLPADVCAEAAGVLLDVLGQVEGLGATLAAAGPPENAPHEPGDTISAAGGPGVG